MMEKRNFVTSARTPKAGAADIDEVLEAGAVAFGRKRMAKTASDRSFEKKASAEDERTDRGL